MIGNLLPFYLFFPSQRNFVFECRMLHPTEPEEARWT